MAKSIEARVQDSFSEANREDIFKYLDWVRSTILDYSQTMRRMATFLILLIAAFEIVANSRKSQITIASFQIARGSVVLTLLPGLVAFLVLQMMTDAGKAHRLITVYQEVFKLWSEKAEANDLDSEVLTDPPLYWTPAGGGFRKENVNRAYKLADDSSLVLTVAVLMGILAFEAHAYYVLFPAHFPNLILWLISLSIALTCLVLTFFLLVWEFWT